MPQPDRSAGRTPSQKRSRIRVKTIAIILALLLVAAVGYVFITVTLLMREQPNPSVDYRAAHMAEVIQRLNLDADRAQRAWDLLITTLEIGPELERIANQALHDTWPENQPYTARFEGDEPVHMFSIGWLGPSIHPSLDRERALINEMNDAGHFASLDEFAALAPAINSQPTQGVLFNMLLPHLRSVRWWSHVLRFRARAAMEAGDDAVFTASITNALAMAQSLALDSPLISRLVAESVRWNILEEILHTVDERDLSEATCLALLEALDRFDFPPPQHAIDGERVVQQDYVQYAYSDDGRGGGYLIADPTGMHDDTGQARALMFAEVLFLRFFGPDRREMLDAIDAQMTRYSNELAKPAATRWRAMPPLRVQRIAMSLLETIMPAMIGSFETMQTGEVQLAATRTALHIERFRARIGHHPDSLTAVETALGITLPTDPLHGGPFGYRVLEAPDEHGRDFLLYSTGLDGVDDGGTEVDDPNRQYGPYAPLRDAVTTAGFDVIFNRPRRPWPASSGDSAPETPGSEPASR